MINLRLIEDQPRWRVALVARLAQLVGVLIHVEGIPFGSNRCRKKQTRGRLGEEASSSAGTAGSAAKATEK